MQTWSASMSRRSSWIGVGNCGLLVRIANASPSVARAIRIVRSFSARPTALAHTAERLLDLPVGVGVVGEHLQTRARADDVVGQRQHDPAGVAVVGHLVAGAVAQDAPHVGTVRRVGREAVGVGPVAAVVVVGHRRVVAGTQQSHGAGVRAHVWLGSDQPGKPIQHVQSAPGGTSLLMTNPRDFDFAACFEAK